MFIVRQLPPLLTALFGDIRNRAENGLLKRAVIALCLGVENLLWLLAENALCFKVAPN